MTGQRVQGEGAGASDGERCCRQAQHRGVLKAALCGEEVRLRRAVPWRDAAFHRMMLTIGLRRCKAIPKMTNSQRNLTENPERKEDTEKSEQTRPKGGVANQEWRPQRAIRNVIGQRAPRRSTTQVNYDRF